MRKKAPMISEATRIKMSISGKLRPPDSEETRKKRSIAAKKRPPVSEETRLKLSISKKGKVPPNKGKPHSKETRIKMSISRKLRPPASKETRKKMSISRKGERCYNWKGGRSFGKYCYLFDHHRKSAVRNFFGNLCISCGKHVTENIVNTRGQIQLAVHHVDHDKEQGCNGKLFNLVPLCHKCHTHEYSREEEYKKYINTSLEEGFKWGIWSRDEYRIKVMYPEKKRI